MEPLNLLAAVDFWTFRGSMPVALATVATLGYLIGLRSRARGEGSIVRSKREFRKAQSVARELEKIAWLVRKHLARHHGSLAKFKQRVSQLSAQQEQAGWRRLCLEAEEMLTPTLRLANQIANAYDQIRQQTNHLMTFTEVRTDPLTGVANRRGLNDALASQFAIGSRYGLAFCVVLFDIDHFKRINDQQGHLHGDQILQRVAKLLDECVRDTDTVTRYGGEEFVVVTPQTDLAGACAFAERWRRRVEDEMPVTVSGGVALALDGDTSETLLARADSALYMAKSSGRNCVFRHNGQQVESIFEEAAPEPITEAVCGDGVCGG